MAGSYARPTMNNYIGRITLTKGMLILSSEVFSRMKRSVFREVVNVWNINSPRNVASNQVDWFFFTTVPVGLANVYDQRIGILCCCLYFVYVDRRKLPVSCRIR